MKKYILSAVAGAVCMLFGLYFASTFQTAQKTEAYKHTDFISNISQEECFVCGNSSNYPISSYWDEDNVGLVNLNTFDLMHIGINCYDDYGQLVEEAAGYMQINYLLGDNTCAHAFMFPDNGYAQVKITGVEYSIDREAIQSHLCQTCLNTINNLWFSGNAPAEYAIVSFAERTIQPLLRNCSWFSSGNYGINCEFMNNGGIDLLVHYCPSRYK